MTFQQAYVFVHVYPTLLPIYSPNVTPVYKTNFFELLPKLLNLSKYFTYLTDQEKSVEADKLHLPFSPYLFWDTSIDKLDAEKHKQCIIERVMSRGLMLDFLPTEIIYT